MQAKRLTLVAGVETAFEFDSFGASSVVVKNETVDEILFCDGPFDALKAIHIPAFSWQSLVITIPYDEKPKFYVRSIAGGDVEIDFGSSGMGVLGTMLDATGMIPHSLTLTVEEGANLSTSLTRLHGQTLDLDTPVALSTGATVFNGDVVVLVATAGEGYHPVLTINGEEVILDEGSATHIIAGETTIEVVAVQDEEG